MLYVLIGKKIEKIDSYLIDLPGAADTPEAAARLVYDFAAQELAEIEAEIILLQDRKTAIAQSAISFEEFCKDLEGLT